jgi:hypothetical protein
MTFSRRNLYKDLNGNELYLKAPQVLEFRVFSE